MVASYGWLPSRGGARSGLGGGLTQPQSGVVSHGRCASATASGLSPRGSRTLTNLGIFAQLLTTLCCSRLSKDHMYHASHTQVLTLTAHWLQLTERLPTAPEGRVGHGGPVGNQVIPG